MDRYEKHIVPVCLVLVFYLICSFIAFDINPTHWLLFTTVPGRFMAVFFAFILIREIIQHYDEY